MSFRQSARGARTNKQHPGVGDVVDMELQCVRCGTRLFVPLPQIHNVLASLERTGAAILICICGQAQLIEAKRHKQHD